MNLQYLPDEQIIVATDELISEYAADTSLYDSVEITTTVTCANTIIKEYPTSDIDNMDNLFFLSGEEFILQPAMFSGGFTDGIYRVNIKFKNTDGFARIYNCIFIDDTFKCRVAALLSSLLKGEENSEIAHLLHYSLFNGSNCGCECDEMCETFNALKEILDNQPVQATDCGCR